MISKIISVVVNDIGEIHDEPFLSLAFALMSLQAKLNMGETV